MCFKETDILLPKEYNNPDFMQKWAVIACDQYTSDIDYWNRVKDFSGNNMSSLNLMFPEIYLESASEEQGAERIKSIAHNMQAYANDFACFENAMFFVERTLKNGAKRFGIVGAVDLEEYSYAKDSRAKIRSTEETVLARIPPRVKIREGADLELPHVMLLYNDEHDILMNGLKRQDMKKIYDFELMQNSGGIKAHLLGEQDINFVKSMTGKFETKKFESDFVFAVGDGNHSLAAAKECYENIKKTVPDYLSHPARYALAEIVNIYDKSLEFEPIYRILFDVDPLDVIKKINDKFELVYTGAGGHKFEIYHGDNYYATTVKSEYNLAVKTLQIFLDDYLAKHGGRIDYIHGKPELIELAKRGNAIGFVCGTVQKDGFFEAIAKDGVLPRKTFSMGEADDKRFYVECRKIK